MVSLGKQPCQISQVAFLHLSTMLCVQMWSFWPKIIIPGTATWWVGFGGGVGLFFPKTAPLFRPSWQKKTTVKCWRVNGQCGLVVQ